MYLNVPNDSEIKDTKFTKNILSTCTVFVYLNGLH